MINLRLSRLMITIAVWLLLTVVVFGSLIGIAWMSFHSAPDVSTDAVVVDTVEDASDEVAPIFYLDDRCYHTPATEQDDAGLQGFGFIGEGKIVYTSPAAYIVTPQNPIGVSILRY